MRGDRQSGREARGRVAGALLRLASELVVPAAIGVATGACVAAASYLVEGRALADLAELPGGLPALFSLLALPATLLVVRYVTRASRPSTAEVYIVAYHEPRSPIVVRQTPGRVLGGAATVSFGGSQGLESPSALIGASFGQLCASGLGRLAGEHERRGWMIAGASAGIAAVFSSPGVGALYGIEVPFRRDVDAPRLVPAVVAAACSYATRVALIGPNQLVTLEARPAIDAPFVLGCLLVAVGCGLGARLFAIATEALRRLGARVGPWTRAVSGSVVLAGLAFSGHALSGAWVTFGPGYVAADWLVAGEHALWLLAVILVVRTAGTLVCVYGGGGGGVFTSLALTGAFVGEIVAHLLGRPEGNVFPVIGAACFLGAGYRIPVAAMLLVAETTGDVTLTVAGIVAVAIGQVLMGDRSVSDAQHDRRGPGGARQDRAASDSPGDGVAVVAETKAASGAGGSRG